MSRFVNGFCRVSRRPDAVTDHRPRHTAANTRPIGPFCELCGRPVLTGSAHDGSGDHTVEAG